MTGPEAKFKKKIVEELKEYCMVTPIQTRTVPGVPDLFVAMSNRVCWIELKSMPKVKYDGNKTYTISFRPGQQAWAYKYFRATRQIPTCVLCLIEFADAIGWFTMTRVLEDCKRSNIQKVESLKLTLDKALCRFWDTVY